MILSGLKIKEEVQKGNIVINPFNIDDINPNSYNYTLGDYVKVYENNELDSKRQEKVKIVPIPDEGLVIEPGRIYLGLTNMCLL